MQQTTQQTARPSAQGPAVPGRARMRDVAERAGVSTQTVSNFINGRYARLSPGTRERIRVAIDEVGYRSLGPGRGRRGSRTRTLGFLVLDESERCLADPLTSLYLAGFADVARAQRYAVLVHTARAADPDLLRPVLENQVDAGCLLLSGRRALRHRVADMVAASGTPFVLLDEILPQSRQHYPVVVADQREGARELVRHLVGRGHRRIAFLAAASEWAVLEERYAGYRGALDEAGIRFDSSLTIFEGGWEPSATSAMVDAVVRLPERATALVCGSDLVAVGAVRHLLDSGFAVPRDVAVCGFDEFPFAPHVEPALTTVAVPAWEMGKAAGVCLIRALAGHRDPGREIRLPVTVRVRASS